MVAVEDGDGTILNYEVNASVGGKLAQIGSRLIDSTAKKMADDFFGRFAETVGGEAEPAAPVQTEEPPAASQETPASAGMRPAYWITALVIAAIALLLYVSR